MFLYTYRKLNNKEIRFKTTKLLLRIVTDRHFEIVSSYLFENLQQKSDDSNGSLSAFSTHWRFRLQPIWCYLFYEMFVGLVLSSPLTNCLYDLVNQPYTGTVNLTNHGYTCQAWTAQYPQTHSKTNDASFPADDSVAGASNYCRNFGGSGRPYCFTLNRYTIWEFCDLQICGGKKHFSNT